MPVSYLHTLFPITHPPLSRPSPLYHHHNKHPPPYPPTTPPFGGKLKLLKLCPALQHKTPLFSSTSGLTSLQGRLMCQLAKKKKKEKEEQRTSPSHLEEEVITS